MIELQYQDGVAVLTLAHGKANVFDAELCEAIAARLEECISAPKCTAIVMTGRGSIFSAGVDLLRVLNEGEPYVRRFLPLLNTALESAFACPKPLIAAVNGHAIAGGCILACAADLRLMARGAGRIGAPELLVGVAFPPVPLEILRFTAAPHHLQSLVFRGLTLTADAAVAAGLVDTAVDPDALLAEAIAAAEALAAPPAAAFAITKRQLRDAALTRMREGRRQFDAGVQDLWCEPQTFAAIRAYIDRTFKKPAG
jgi:enoyl-CoA hydratase